MVLDTRSDVAAGGVGDADVAISLLAGLPLLPRSSSRQQPPELPVSAPLRVTLDEVVYRLCAAATAAAVLSAAKRR